MRLLEALGATKFAISPAEVKANPFLLADEAAALSLFGERRLIWLEPATTDIVEAVEALLAAQAIESPVVAIAGALPKSSPLLKLAEAAPSALAFTAYVPDGDEAGRMVAELGRRVGLKIGPAVAARLASNCGNDQALVSRELEKLALYVGASANSPKELDHAAIDNIGADNSEGDFLKLADFALLGEVEELVQATERLSAGGTEAIPTLRSLQRRILMLARERARIERGERLDAVMTSLAKSLFWKDKPKVERMLKKWTAKDLATILERSSDLECRLMFSQVPEKAALGEELLAIARKAHSVQRP